MDWMVDTNILLRLTERGSPHHLLARVSLGTIRRAGGILYIVPQNLVEFWSVASRPRSANGLGYDIAQTDRAVRSLERLFPLIPDNASIHEEWRRLVLDGNVSGRQVHDARIAAAMTVHNIGRILTFNVADFRRYPGILAVDPVDTGPIP